MNIKIFFVLCCLTLQNCSKLDDYMLGKDNTPQPKKLAVLQKEVNVVEGWNISLGKSSKNKEFLRLNPVIANHVLYIANMEGAIHAINVNTGSVIWSKKLKQQLVSGPTLNQNYLSVSTDHASLIVFSANNGQKLWQKRLSSEILSPPTINGEKLIVKTINGKVVAFDLKNGTEIWTYDHGSPALMLKASSSPIISGNLVINGFSDGKIDALDINNGRLVWQRSMAYASGSSDVEGLVDISADPIIENNVIYLASYQGYIGAMSLTDGQFIWRKPASVYKNMVLKGNVIYFVDSKDTLWALNKNNGSTLWKQNGLKARALTAPILSNSYLILADKTSYVHFIDPTNGILVGHYKLRSGTHYSPTTLNNKIYIYTDNGMLYQLSAS